MRRMRCLITLLLFLFALSTVYAAADPRGIQIVKDKQGAEVCLYKESHALLIGVSDYTAGWPDLAGVKKDIPRVKAALENQALPGLWGDCSLSG
ncbi:MAG: hypothetical protein E4H02_11975 [Lentisphaerales bacterium]|nr:MAG: hypothetical protein E4H02_11975 [Lentisphaerales bacterium]